MSSLQVILVNELDEPQGAMEKMQAHELGLLHRAFSVFLFDSRGRMLLQQRAQTKYHGALLWTNACCSHPSPGEETHAAAKRRLNEELGITTDLQEIFSFTYRAEVENSLVEHEFDHVFAGEFDGEVSMNASEVANVAFEDMEQLAWSLKNHPEKFTSWFRIAFPRIETWWNDKYGTLRNGSREPRLLSKRKTT